MCCLFCRVDLWDFGENLHGGGGGGEKWDPQPLSTFSYGTGVEGLNPDWIFQASEAALGSVLHDFQGDRSNFHPGCSHDRLRWPGRTIWAHVHSGLAKTHISPEDTSHTCSLASGRLLQASLQAPRCTPGKA